MLATVSADALVEQCAMQLEASGKEGASEGAVALRQDSALGALLKTVLGMLPELSKEHATKSAAAAVQQQQQQPAPPTAAGAGGVVAPEADAAHTAGTMAVDAQAAAKRSAEAAAPPAKRQSGLGSVRTSRADFLKARSLEAAADEEEL